MCVCEYIRARIYFEYRRAKKYKRINFLNIYLDTHTHFLYTKYFHPQTKFRCCFYVCKGENLICRHTASYNSKHIIAKYGKKLKENFSFKNFVNWNISWNSKQNETTKKKWVRTKWCDCTCVCVYVQMNFHNFRITL